MFNEVSLIGRLVRDAESSTFGEKETKKLSFRLAVDRDYRDSEGNVPTDFWPVEIIGEYGDKLKPHLLKGRLIAVHGSAHINESNGETYRVYPYVRGDKVRFLDGKK